MNSDCFNEWYQSATENEQVDWLIKLFNKTFEHTHTVLVRSDNEPEYFPVIFNEKGQVQRFARIAFAHGYFASALHEISHWCIAGKKRRLLADFGYWYEPDGRTPEQQRQFEQVEVKPQALEWMFSVICSKRFRVSIDNLTAAPAETYQFKNNICQQINDYLSYPDSIPKDARKWLGVLNAVFYEHDDYLLRLKKHHFGISTC